jgi:hypothetical protein
MTQPENSHIAAQVADALARGKQIEESNRASVTPVNRKETQLDRIEAKLDEVLLILRKG